jgi:hypothetical protein
LTTADTREPHKADLQQYARRGDVITLVQLLRQREGLDLVTAKDRAEAMIGAARGGA